MPMHTLARKPALALGATAMIVFGASGISVAAANTQTPSISRIAHGGGPGGPGLDTAALASALGVTTADLEAAIKTVREEGSSSDANDRTASVKAIADALGVSQSTVETVIRAQAPSGTNAPTATPTATPTGTTPQATTPPAGRPGGHGKLDESRLIAALVKATGKTEAQVKAAVAKGDAVRDAARSAAAADFAKRLAGALHLDQDKVATAIDSTRSVRPSSPANQTTSTS